MLKTIDRLWFTTKVGIGIAAFSYAFETIPSIEIPRFVTEAAATATPFDEIDRVLEDLDSQPNMAGVAIADAWSFEGPTEKIIRKAARFNGVPEEFALAVAQRESAMNPDETGLAGEIGLFQIKCGHDKAGRQKTAQVMGYAGNCRDLYDPQANAYWGTLHLAQALERADGDLCNAATRHNRGLATDQRCSDYGRQVLAMMGD